MKPLFRYIGGKTFLKNKLIDSFNIILNNNKFTSYEEWFAGGLGSFFAVADTLLEHNIKKVTLNDINPTIMSLYNYINKGDRYIKHLIDMYVEIEDTFHAQIPSAANELDKTKDKEKLKELLSGANLVYKLFCRRFNDYEVSIEKAVYLIFLQNHCFNGIYRENLKGEYNTPFNWSPRLITRENITQKIKDVVKCFDKFDLTFTSVSFEKIEKSDALIYLDPPYINEKISENKYNKNNFNLDKQIELLEKIKDYSFIYSNHNDKRILDYFDNNYKKDELIISTVTRKNIISSSAESRANDVKEIIIVKK